MNKYDKQIKVISKNENLADSEKISALTSLLSEFEGKALNIDNYIKENYISLANSQSKFYWRQMVITVVAGIITMSTAAKSLDSNDILTLNNLIFALSGAVTATGLGSMFAEELGVPITKEDRLRRDSLKLETACEKIKEILAKMQNKSQTQTEPMQQ